MNNEMLYDDALAWATKVDIIHEYCLDRTCCNDYQSLIEDYKSVVLNATNNRSILE